MFNGILLQMCMQTKMQFECKITDLRLVYLRCVFQTKTNALLGPTNVPFTPNASTRLARTNVNARVASREMAWPVTMWMNAILESTIATSRARAVSTRRAASSANANRDTVAAHAPDATVSVTDFYPQICVLNFYPLLQVISHSPTDKRYFRWR